jgi:AcrR family transcriptional regulator
MSKPDGLRNQKKAETRQAISHVATRLFIERGFDNVSVAEVAREAGVARKTVFNYFLRKEDLIFDREEEVRALVRDAITGRGAQSPVRAFEAAMRALVDTGHPIFQMSARPIQFWRTVGASPSLTTYARELQVTLGDDLAAMLADALGRPHTDPDARLAAGMLVSTLVVAYGDALRAFREEQDPVTAFVRVMEQGFKGVDAAVAGTAYV